MARCYLVWGDIRDAEARIAYAARLPEEDLQWQASSHPYASVRMGPVEVAGPVVAIGPGDVDSVGAESGDVVVLVGADIPDWVAHGRPREWGWEQVSEVPPPQRLPFPVDVLLLCPGAESSRLEGWSSTLWFDAGVRPLQRMSLDVGNGAGVGVDVRVLECGALGTGTGHVVAYSPDREQVAAAALARLGWWQEPWVQVRADDWAALAMLSDAVETHVTTVLRSPVVSEVEVHDLLGIPDGSLSLLPEDVRDGLERALRAMPG